MKKAKKLPVGLMPQILFEEEKQYERLHQISNAICRYADAEMLIPPLWADELSKRIDQYKFMSGQVQMSKHAGRK